MITSLEGWPTKAKEAPSPHEVRLAPLDTNPVFQCLEGKSHNSNFTIKVSKFFGGHPVEVGILPNIESLCKLSIKLM